MGAPPTPHLDTPRLLLRLAGQEHADRLIDYYRRNASHLEPWEPRRPEDFLSPARWEHQIEASRLEFEAGRAVRMVLLERADPERRVVGVANLTGIVRAAFQACYLGYSIDRGLEGRGYMREALEAALEYAFGELDLHRVMANFRPENDRSGALLERLGFEREGLARAYLRIDGAWRDHVLTARIRDEDG